MTTCLTAASQTVAGEPVTKCPLCYKPWSQCTYGGRLRPCQAGPDTSWETPCPVTGKNACPSDAAAQAACPQC